MSQDGAIPSLKTRHATRGAGAASRKRAGGSYFARDDTGAQTVDRVREAVDAVSPAWRIEALFALLQEPARFTELRADLPGVSAKMLSRTLRDLEAASVIERDARSATYRVTARGRSLATALLGLVPLADR